jgi:hypothetical protein
MVVAGDARPLDLADHDEVEYAGRSSRMKNGIEDPGRSAGPKVPDEERKGFQAGTAAPGGTIVLVDLSPMEVNVGNNVRVYGIAKIAASRRGTNHHR